MLANNFSHSASCLFYPWFLLLCKTILCISKEIMSHFICVCVLFILFYFYFTILYWFCHTLTWINYGCTCVPNPEPTSHYPLHIISLGHPSAPAPSILYTISNIDWQFISYMIIYMFQCRSPKSSYPLPLPQSPKDCSIHLCLFCYLTYRVIATIFLNSICISILHWCFLSGLLHSV